MIKLWSCSYKVTQPGLEPRSGLKFCAFNHYTIYCLSREMEDSCLLMSWLGISKINGWNYDRPAEIWHFYQKIFHFLCWMLTSSLSEKEVKVELARKMTKVKWTGISLPKQVNISLLPGFCGASNCHCFFWKRHCSPSGRCRPTVVMATAGEASSLIPELIINWGVW